MRKFGLIFMLIILLSALLVGGFLFTRKYINQREEQAKTNQKQEDLINFKTQLLNHENIRIVLVGAALDFVPIEKMRQMYGFKKYDIDVFRIPLTR